MVTICTEGSESIDKFQHKFLFGDGTEGPGHRHNEYPMMTPGGILRMALGAKTNDGIDVGKTAFSVVLDGKAQYDYKVTEPENQHSAITTFKQILELRLGRVIYFMPTRTDTEAVATVVSLLIELDISIVNTIQQWACGQATTRGKLKGRKSAESHILFGNS